MPILSDLSRRFHLLTTDAKPDPPRIPIEGHTNNLRSSDEENTKRKSFLRQPISKEEHVKGSYPSFQRQKSAPNGGTTPITPTDFPPRGRRSLDNNDNDKYNGDGVGVSDDLPSMNGFKEYKKPNVKTKTKSRTAKSSQSANIINYNIVNSNGVKIGARTSYICNINNFSTNKSVPTDANWSKSKSRLMPENVELLTRCYDEITFEDMFLIKTHLGHGWKDVARRLFYSDGQIEQFEENYRDEGIDEVIYQLLLDWKQANAKDAHIGNLIHVLWLSQEYDCAERLANARTKRS
ncbi:protein immune deficiency-like [Vespa mandarinia]|uniref:protein immune deficiency-like n=1 Tax=Vespa mandarinia TaxID=7446 RepID=UPI00160D4E4C|nr:protein immune deficiency-like [Vespa mandarinia]XP_035719837.1 protein immune deficiency-like [Vespa mandarinia]